MPPVYRDNQLQLHNLAAPLSIVWLILFRNQAIAIVLTDQLLSQLATSPSPSWLLIDHEAFKL